MMTTQAEIGPRDPDSNNVGLDLGHISVILVVLIMLKWGIKRFC
jgi:hypothetical protein